ncbi:MAG: hypothetical protein RSE43_10635 [Oscillospiraceae bacterium]
MSRLLLTKSAVKEVLIIGTQKDNAALLQEAVARRMGQLNHIGESKKTARESYNAKLQTQAKANGAPPPSWQQSPFIHGLETMRQYSAICKDYAKWLAAEHPEVRKLSYAHTHDFDREFVQQQIDADRSAWTIDRTCAALAKLHGCTMGEVHNARPARTRSNIKRGRSYSEAQYSDDVNRYGDVAELCRSVGVRRCELLTLTSDCFVRDSSGNLTLQLDGRANNTKGGKCRTVEILPQNEATVQRIIAKFKPYEVMFSQVPKRLNVHAIRALYAQDFYNNIAADLNVLRGKQIHDHKGRSVPSVYHCRDGKTTPHRAYDRAALMRVSHSLGHNRADVIATHYLQ